MGRVLHFEIHATDPQALMAFYTELLGWSFSKWGDVDYWLIETGPADKPGINGALLPRRGVGPADAQGVNAFVCTAEVAALDEAVEKGTAMGGAIALPRMAVLGVGWVAYLKDPDGNILGLLEPDESAA
jgi:uncharacterized protein